MAINSIKKFLLAGTALVAVSAFSVQAQATEIASPTGVTVTVTDAAGLTEVTAGATAVTIDSTGGAITLGANATPSLAVGGDATTALTVTIDSSGVQNGVIFADNITETLGQVVFNISEDNVTFQGNVSDSLITAGSGSADPTIALTVDTANAENITFAAPISAVDAADVVNLLVRNTNGGANTTTFTGVIGGATAATALDAIQIGVDVAAKPMDVTFGANVNAATITLEAANVNNNTVNVRFGTAAATSTVTGVIAGAAAGDTNNITVVGGSTVTFNSAFGANIDAIQIGADATATTATFKGAVASGPITIGAGATVDINSVTLDTTGGLFTVAGLINGGHANDTNALVVTGGAVATVTGAIGTAGTTLMDTVTLSGAAGTGLTTGGALSATTITVGAGNTLTTGGLVTGAVNISGAAGTVTLGDGLDITGAVNNTSGTAAVGVLNIGDAAGGSASIVSGVIGASNSLAAINLTGAGNAQFSETVNAATITASVDAGTLEFAKAVTGTINMSADAVVTLAADADVTGTINNTSGVTAKGTLNSTSTGVTNTISGAVGGTTAAQRLKDVILTGAGTTAFGSTVNSADITFAAGPSTATFANDVTVTNNLDFADFAGVATFADGADFTGLIEDTLQGKGTVNFSGSSIVTGSLGTAANDINAVVFNGIAGKTVTISGASKAATYTVAGAGEVDFNNDTIGALAISATEGTAKIAAGKTWTGGISGTGGIVGTGVGNVVFSGASSLITTVGTGGAILKSITLSGDNTIVSSTGAYLAADTMALGNNTLSVLGGGGTFGMSGGGVTQTLTSTIETAAIYGHVASGGAAAVNAATALDLTFDTALYLPTTTFTIVDGTGAGTVGTLAAGKLTVNGVNSGATQAVTAGVFTFTQVAPVAGEDLQILATRLAVDAVSTTVNGDAVGDALDAITTTGDPGLDVIQGKVQGAGTATEVNEVLESLVPTVDGATITAALDISNMTMGLTDTRMASLRSGDGMSGMAAGTSAGGVNMWLQGYGQSANQDRHDGIDGYDSTTWGGALGVDTTTIMDGGAIGLAFNYGQTDIDSKNANTTATTIDSYGLTLYGNHDIGRSMFVNSQIGYSYNDISGARHNVGGVIGDTARHETHSDQYAARLALGRDYAMDYGMTVTPTVSAGYTYIDTRGYTETGSGGDLTVASSDVNVLNLGIGMNAAWNLKNSDGSMMKPSVRFGYTYDAIGDAVQNSSSFVGELVPGANAFATSGPEPETSTFTAGAGMVYMTTANWDMSVNYDYTYKGDFDAHNGVLRATSHF